MIPNLTENAIFIYIGYQLWGMIYNSYLVALLVSVIHQHVLSRFTCSLEINEASVHTADDFIEEFCKDRNNSTINISAGTTRKILNGSTVITYNSKYMYIHVSKDYNKQSGFFESTKLFVRVLTTDSNYFNKIMTKIENKKDKKIYLQEEHYWTVYKKMPSRRLSDTIIPTDNNKMIMNKLNTFYSKPEYYSKYNIPYKNVILLTGPPGFGKSSLIISLANEFNKNIYSLNVKRATDKNIIGLIKRITEDSILIFEDIDSLNIGGTSKLSMSTFLNILDGIMSKEGLLIILTTNHPENLSQAITRQERINLIIKLDRNRECYHDMIYKYTRSDNIPARCVELCYDNYVSMADLQAHCIHYIEEPNAITEKIDDLIANCKIRKELVSKIEEPKEEPEIDNNHGYSSMKFTPVTDKELLHAWVGN